MLGSAVRLLRSEIILGFLIATICWIGVLGWQAAYEPSKMEKEKCQQAAEKFGTKAENCKNLWEKTTSDPVAFFTLWLVIATAGLGALAIVQIRFLVNADVTARASARAAQRAAATAERALVVVERAFIMISDMNVSTIGQYGTIIDYRIAINVSNSGRTPARNYISVANLVLFNGDIPESFRFPDRTHDDVLETGTTVGPQARPYIQVDFFIQDAIDVFEGRKKALIYGWLEYDDIFPDSPRHRTEFCMWIEVYADPRQTVQVVYGKPPPILTIRAYRRYNGHDDDCMYHPGQTPIAEEGELPPITPPPVVQPPPGFKPPPPMSVSAQFQYGPDGG
jgi:hypothetical protein